MHARKYDLSWSHFNSELNLMTLEAWPESNSTGNNARESFTENG